MQNSGRYYTLDAMRGIGAIAVLQFHAIDIMPLAHSGYIAVDFFFALSGFVLAKTYSDRFRDGLTVKQFMISRYKRLYPLYAVGIIFGTIVMGLKALAGNGDLLNVQLSFLFNIVMMPVPWAAPNMFPLNSPAWTLFLELLMNVAFAAGLYKLSTTRLALLAALSGAALTLFMLQADALGGWNWSTFHIGVARIVFSFTVGLIVARLPINRSVSWASILVALALIFVLYLPHAKEAQATLALFSILLACPPILIAGCLFEIPKRFIPLAKFLGDVSYPLYAVHLPLIPIFRALIRKLQLDQFSGLLVLTLGMLLLAFLVNILVTRSVRWFLAGRLPQRA